MQNTQYDTIRKPLQQNIIQRGGISFTPYHIPLHASLLQDKYGVVRIYQYNSYITVALIVR